MLSGMDPATNESGSSRMLPKDQIDSPLFDEGSYNGNLKKGPWTAAEDVILVEYVKKHGEGNWNAVQKNTGLSRCGKSCRLRWANHLKPNLKKGAFTPDEEKLIIQLHAEMGNKWARMAAYLPGRTDNEIKNYWNTRIKRCQRAGLPLYPSNLCFQMSNENQHSHGALDFGSDNRSEFLQGNNFHISDAMFGNFNTNQGVLSSASPLYVGNMLGHAFGPQTYDFINSTSYHFPYHQPDTFLPGFHDTVSTGPLAVEQFSDYVSGRFTGTHGLDFFCVPDFSRKNLAPFGDAVSGSHAIINGNFSASKPLNGTKKSELPSLQYSETDNWISCPYSPYDEAVDMDIQSPTTTESAQSGSASPWKSGLLETVLQESKTLFSAKNCQSDMSTNSYTVTPSDMVESTAVNLCDRGCEDSSSPISPFGCYSASTFSECTPPISRTWSDEIPLSRASSGTDIGSATAESVPGLLMRKRDIPPRPDFLRPDALLDSDCLLQDPEVANEYAMLNDAIATLLNEEDLSSEYKNRHAGTSSVHGTELDYYPWNNMPGVCLKSEDLKFT